MKISLFLFRLGKLVLGRLFIELLLNVYPYVTHPFVAPSGKIVETLTLRSMQLTNLTLLLYKSQPIIGLFV